MIGTRFDLTGRVALVTGGSKGLGKAIAQGFAEAGADLVIASRTESELKAAADELGTKALVKWIVADLSRARRGRAACTRRTGGVWPD